MITQMEQIELKTPWFQVATPYPIKKVPEVTPTPPVPPVEKKPFPYLPIILGSAGLVLLIYLLKRK